MLVVGLAAGCGDRLYGQDGGQSSDDGTSTDGGDDADSGDGDGDGDDYHCAVAGLQRLATVPTGGSVQGVAVREHFVFVADAFQGLLVFDASDPTDPVEIGRSSAQAFPTAITLQGATALVATENGPGAFDLSNLESPELVYLGGGYTLDVEAHVGYLFEFKQTGLWINDVADPTDVEGAGYFEIDAEPFPNARLAYSRDRVYLPAGDEGLHIIDVRNPYAPVGVGNYPDGGYVGAVKARGDFVYLPTEAGLEVLDVSDPGLVMRVGAVPTTSMFGGSDIQGNLLYLSGLNEVFRVFDVGDPTQPVLAAELELESVGFDVVAQDDLIFEAVDDLGLVIMELDCE